MTKRVFRNSKFAGKLPGYGQFFRYHPSSSIDLTYQQFLTCQKGEKKCILSTNLTLVMLFPKTGRNSKNERRVFFAIGVVLLLLFFGGAWLLQGTPTKAATAPAIVTYQGKLLVNGLAATTTQSMKILLYDAVTGGNALYTVSGTLAAPTTINVTPTSGLFSVDLGSSGTNALDNTIFQTNGSVYLEVRVGAETLTPRKQITTAPYAFNARQLDGVTATSTASSSTYIPISDSSGNFQFNRVTSTGAYVTGNSTFIATTTFATSTFTSSTLTNANITNLTVTNCIGCATSSAQLAGNQIFTGSNTFSATTTFATTTVVSSTITNANLGTVAITGNSALGGTLGVSGLATFTGGLLSSVSSTFSSNLQISGALRASSTFLVDGATTIAGALSATAAGTGLAVTNNATIGGTLGVTGVTTLSNALSVVGLSSLTQASSTRLSVVDRIYVGGSATTTIFGDSTTSTFSGGISVASGNINLPSGSVYLINNTNVLSATTLGSAVVNSSLTSVGALGSGSITSGFGAIDIGADALTAGVGTFAGNVNPSTGGLYDLGTASTKWRYGNFQGGVFVNDISAALGFSVTSSLSNTQLIIGQTPSADLGKFYVDFSGNVSASGTLTVASCTGCSNLAADWVKQTNFGTLTLTPSTTVPLWLKSSEPLYSSSSIIVGNAGVSTTVAANYLSVTDGTTTSIHTATSLILGQRNSGFNQGVFFVDGSAAGNGAIYTSSSINAITTSTINVALGIGTSTPVAKFTVSNGVFLVEGTGGGGNPLPSEAGTRMMWIPSKGAFRAGRLTGGGAASWDDASIGQNSFVLGVNNIASGATSIALGNGNRPESDDSIGIGVENFIAGLAGGATNNIGIGYRSNVNAVSAASYNYMFGYQNTADYGYGTAIGDNNTVHAPNASAFGSGNSVANGGAGGQYSIALGRSNIINGIASFVLGTDNNTISGNHAGAVGIGNSVSGPSSFAFGATNTVSGINSIALGNLLTVSGNNSMAIGGTSTAYTLAQNNTIAMLSNYVGIGTLAPNFLLTVAGSNAGLAVGNGSTTSSLESNKLVIASSTADALGKFYVDSSGNVSASGTLQVFGATTFTGGVTYSGLNTFQAGFISQVSSTVLRLNIGGGIASTTLNGNYLSLGNGTSSTVATATSLIVGQASNFNAGVFYVDGSPTGDGAISTSGTILAQGIYTGVVGGAPASGAGTRLMWVPAKAAFRAGAVAGTQWDDSSIGNYSVAFGQNNTVSGNYSAAVGWASNVAGDYSFASGDQNTVSGNYSTAFGHANTASGIISIALGDSNQATGSHSIAMGGIGSQATGDYAVLIGLDTTGPILAQANTMAIIGGNVGIGTLTPYSLLTLGNGSLNVQGGGVFAGSGTVTSSLESNKLVIASSTVDALGKFYVDSSGNVSVSGTLRFGSVSATGTFSSDIVLNDDEKSIYFPLSTGSNKPMIYMYQTGSNASRTVLAESPQYNAWGLQYTPASSTFDFIKGTTNPSDVAMQIDLFNKRVGINTTTPAWSLVVQGGICITTGNNCGAEVNGGLKVDTAGGNGADDPGDVFDIAERYPASQVMEAGDVVAVDTAAPERATIKKALVNDTAIGVVSTKPALAINGSDVVMGPAAEVTSTRPLVALAGRVPVKVSTSQGSIQRGDQLTLSSIPGVAVKAVGEGPTIGVALETYDGTEIGKVLTFVKLGWNHGLTIKTSNNGEIILPTDFNINNQVLINVAAIKGQDNRWEIDAEGRFITRLSTSAGDKEMVAMQSPTAEFVFSSSSQLVAGEARIIFDQATEEIVDSATPLKVTVTLTSGEAKGIYVSEKTAQGFVVKELSGGTSNATFDWIVVAKRRVHNTTPAEGPDPNLVVPPPSPPDPNLQIPAPPPESTTSTSSTPPSESSSITPAHGESTAPSTTP